MDLLTIVLYVMAVALVLAGVVGAALPLLPGTALIVAGAVVLAFATGFTVIGPGRLWVLVGLMVVAEALDYVAGVIGARRAGGTRWAMAGAWLGAVVGLFFGLPGLLVGPPLGAVVGEWLRSRRLRGSVEVGIGTMIGMALGVTAKLALAVVMAALVGWWAVRG